MLLSPTPQTVILAVLIKIEWWFIPFLHPTPQTADPAVWSQKHKQVNVCVFCVPHSEALSDIIRGVLDRPLSSRAPSTSDLARVADRSSSLPPVPSFLQSRCVWGGCLV